MRVLFTNEELMRLVNAARDQADSNPEAFLQMACAICFAAGLWNIGVDDLRRAVDLITGALYQRQRDILLAKESS